MKRRNKENKVGEQLAASIPAEEDAFGIGCVTPVQILIIGVLHGLNNAKFGLSLLQSVYRGLCMGSLETRKKCHCQTMQAPVFPIHHLRTYAESPDLSRQMLECCCAPPQHLNAATS